MKGLFQQWARTHPPDREFLRGDDGSLTYGDIAGASPPAEDADRVVEPDERLASVVDLMTVPGPGRRLVVVDPGLPAEERGRRAESVRSGGGREALTILFTSGTTGPAKGVRLTARNWRSAAAASATHLSHRPDDVWLAAMPLHHVGGLSILYRSAYVGASVRWLPGFDTARVVAELRGAVTLASLVPTMLRRVLDHDRRPFAGVRAVLVGGAPIPSGLLEEARGRGLPVLPTYGMTETCAQVATLRPGAPARRAAHLLPGVEVRIGAGERIELRGEQVSPGYVDDDDRAPGEWFTTPDRGRLEGDGALVVLGRADRVIVSGGENVDPDQVEGALLDHPEVEEVAVVGVADPEWGTVLAAVYRGAVEPEPLREWCRARLAPYERPKRLRRVEQIPTAATGKPDRDRIQQLLEDRWGL